MSFGMSACTVMDGLAGLDDLKGPFQPSRFCDSLL